MKGAIVGILFLLTFPGMAQADPPRGAHWVRLPALSDEFKGKTLDGAKWWPNNPDWQGRQPGWFAKENVQVKSGSLQITMRREDRAGLPAGYHTYTSGAVKSKTRVLYGFFEARCRAMNSHGSSAFWFYDITPDWWTEIDVFEIGGAAPGEMRADHTTLHVWHTPTTKTHWAKGETWTTPAPLAEAFHVYGLDWERDRITYYFDGKIIRTLPNTDWHQPLFLNFDSETMPDWFGLPLDSELPSTFSIDWIRAWQKK